MFSMKRFIAILMMFVMLFSLVGCNKTDKNEDSATLTIAYQGGTGYAPVHILEAQKLIENNYRELTGKEVKVTFRKLDSGPDINSGIIGGTIDIGCMGLAPAISAVAGGIPAKIMNGLCSQSHGLMTNDESIKELSDIKNEQIALVNIGSFQHILLAMACEKELGNAHALDDNIVKMAHAEGFAALQAGTYKLHLTSSPFINRERENSDYHEIKSVNEIWPDGNTFLVALGSETLKSENPELYTAAENAFNEAIAFINENPQQSAEIVAEKLEMDVDTTLSYLTDETSEFFGNLKGVTQMADFMYRAEFISSNVTFNDLVFSGVEGN